MAYNPRAGVTGMPLISMELVMDDFNKMLRTFLTSLSSPRAAVAVAKIALDLLYLVIRKNPVLTGRSRAAWYPGFNALLQYAKSKTAAMAPRNADEAGGYARGSYDIQLGGLQKSVVLTNAVEYIEALEYGYSTKAPYGMVRISIMLIMKQIPAQIEAELRQLWQAAGVAAGYHWNQSPQGPTRFFRGPVFPGQPSLNTTTP